MGYVAGAYRATYNALALGQTEDGFEFDYGQVAEEIVSDIFRGRQDGVYQGIDLVIRTVLTELTAAGIQSLTWPWHTTLGHSGVTGRLWSTMAKPLVLTACAGTTATPGTITIPKALIGTDRINTKYNNAQRKLPVTIISIPTPENGSLPLGSTIDCEGGILYVAV